MSYWELSGEPTGDSPDADDDAIDRHALQPERDRCISLSRAFGVALVRGIVAGFAFTLESSPRLLADRVARWLERPPPDYWDTLPDRVMAVTAARVREVAAQYWSSDRPQIVGVDQRVSISNASSRLDPGFDLDASNDLCPAPDVRPGR